MFRVKICGITNRQDAQAVAAAGADAIGLNFAPDSPRFCTLDRAREIVAGLAPGVRKVGVFVGASAEEIRRAARSVPLDLVQLHGDEPPEFLREIRPLPVMRALPAEGDLSEIGAYLAACHGLSAMPRMLLIDARHGAKFGGTGTTVDWKVLRENRPRLAGLPLVLAGGLSPENVAAAILEVRPWAVDVASGVESAPGKKSPQQVRDFVAAAKAAFERLRIRG